MYNYILKWEYLNKKPSINLYLIYYLLSYLVFLFYYTIANLHTILVVKANRHIEYKSDNIARAYTYDAFGNILSESGTLNSHSQYTGREYDSETELYYYRARYYDPQIGRFITPDPIGFKGGINFYSYVKNSPINFIDPLGLVICKVSPEAIVKCPDPDPGFSFRNASFFTTGPVVCRYNINPETGQTEEDCFPAGPATACTATCFYIRTETKRCMKEKKVEVTQKSAISCTVINGQAI